MAEDGPGKLAYDIFNIKRTRYTVHF